jgi:phosphoglycolate phosphatase
MRDATIVFDLDGTLVDTAPDLIHATNHTLRLCDLPPVAASELRPWISFGARRMIVEALRYAGAERTDSEVDKLLAEFLTHYSANIAATSRPFDDAREVLSRLRSAGARVAICTNKRESLSRQLLTELDWLHHFDALAGRDTFPVCKPDPEHLFGAIRLANGNRSRAIMVGDSPTDIATARAAGIKVVAVSFGYTEVPPEDLGADILIDHYTQLEQALADLLACA